MCAHVCKYKFPSNQQHLTHAETETLAAWDHLDFRRTHSPRMLFNCSLLYGAAQGESKDGVNTQCCKAVSFCYSTVGSNSN